MQASLAKKSQQLPGILITIDELHYSATEQMRQLGATVQHLIRENANIAVVFAGIPAAVKPLLATADNHNPVTFLRRAHRIELGPVPKSEVSRGLTEPLTVYNYAWQGAALEIATAGCKGYPFLIQLVGSELFKLAQSTHIISEQLAHTAVNNAKNQLHRLVHEPALQDLSERDLEYLTAMASDEQVSKTATIADRLHLTPQSANTYRIRLIEQELIAAAGHGKVRFVLPYLRDYLRIRPNLTTAVFF